MSAEENPNGTSTEEIQKPELIDRQLTLTDMLSLNQKKYKIPIPQLGYVIIRRSTGKDEEVSLISSNDGKNKINYMAMMVYLCTLKPQFKDEEEVLKLPDGIATTILKAINTLTNQFGDTDFLEM